MKREYLEASQMLSQHPVKGEKEAFKTGYINVLEYFVRKYSDTDMWANSVLKLYKAKLLENQDQYRYACHDIKKISRSVISTKFKHFKFFSYRFCLIFDCIFMNAMDDKEKADRIFSELLTLHHERYRKNISYVYQALYDFSVDIEQFDYVPYMMQCWKKNQQYRHKTPTKILVTANMSAGKSTLLNAIIGKKVNKTQNDSCTAKIHYILKKPYEDGFNYEWDYELELDADYQTLMEDDENNQSSEIIVGSYFRSPLAHDTKRIWFIDTPGVNSSQDEEHHIITENTVKHSDSDILLYVMNGENLGTDDDRKHLKFVRDYYNRPILFVVNKVDRFRKKEDSVLDTLKETVSDLKNLGFEKPVVLPVSSYAGYLAKMKIYGESLNEDEQDEFDRLLRKLSRDEYQFDTYYPENIQKKVHVDESDEGYRLLKHTGILQLETILYGI